MRSSLTDCNRAGLKRLWEEVGLGGETDVDPGALLDFCGVLLPPECGDVYTKSRGFMELASSRVGLLSAKALCTRSEGESLASRQRRERDGVRPERTVTISWTCGSKECTRTSINCRSPRFISPFTSTHFVCSA